MLGTDNMLYTVFFLVVLVFSTRQCVTFGEKSAYLMFLGSDCDVNILSIIFVLHAYQKALLASSDWWVFHR